MRYCHVLSPIHHTQSPFACQLFTSHFLFLTSPYSLQTSLPPPPPFPTSFSLSVVADLLFWRFASTRGNHLCSFSFSLFSTHRFGFISNRACSGQLKNLSSVQGYVYNSTFQLGESVTRSCYFRLLAKEQKNQEKKNYYFRFSWCLAIVSGPPFANLPTLLHSRLSSDHLVEDTLNVIQLETFTTTISE